jgi:glycerol uptake facilitator-like aquaporin
MVALNLFVYLLIAIIGSAIGMLLLLWMVSKETRRIDTLSESRMGRPEGHGSHSEY